MNLFSVRYFALLTLFSVAVYASEEAASAQKDMKRIPTQELITMLREKYHAKTLEDLRPWTTAQEIAGLGYEEYEEYTEDSDIFWGEVKDLLSVLFGLRPLGQVIVDNTTLKKYPILYEILQRPDCPLKFLFIPAGEYYIKYVYNTQFADAEHDAYLLALHGVETSNRPYDATFLGGKVVDAGDTYYESAYVNGRLFSYPEKEIEGYVGVKNWERAKRLGEAWLNKNKVKTIEQLRLEIWQQIQESARRKLFQ
jgi:hypothetical protein